MLIHDATDNKDEKILEELASQKLSYFVEHLQRELPKDNVPLQVINAIVMILRLFSIIKRKESKYQKEKERQRKLCE